MKCFPSTLPQRNLKTQQSLLIILDLCFAQPRRFRKAFVFKIVWSTLKRMVAKPAFSNSSGLKSVFEKLCFRDGSVWTVGLTGEIKLRYLWRSMHYRTYVPCKEKFLLSSTFNFRYSGLNLHEKVDFDHMSLTVLALSRSNNLKL